MDELNLITSEDDNLALEKYLSDSIISYGLEQLKGHQPRKLYCCYKNKDGEIVAGIMGSKTLNLFFISHLFVEPEYRNSGLGSKLLSAIEKAARQAGCDMLRLNTFNKKTHTLYLKAGFDVSTQIPNYMNEFDLVYYHKNIR